MGSKGEGHEVEEDKNTIRGNLNPCSHGPFGIKSRDSNLNKDESIENQGNQDRKSKILQLSWLQPMEALLACWERDCKRCPFGAR